MAEPERTGATTMAQREGELRSCLQQIEAQRAAQVGACHAFQAHVTAEIDRLHGLKADVQRRLAAIEGMYSQAAEQLTQAFVEVRDRSRAEGT